MYNLVCITNIDKLRKLSNTESTIQKYLLYIYKLKVWFFLNNRKSRENSVKAECHHFLPEFKTLYVKFVLSKQRMNKFTTFKIYKQTHTITFQYNSLKKYFYLFFADMLHHFFPMQCDNGDVTCGQVEHSDCHNQKTIPKYYYNIMNIKFQIFKKYIFNINSQFNILQVHKSIKYHCTKST